MRRTAVILFILVLVNGMYVVAQTDPVSFNVLPDFGNQAFQVTMEVSGLKRDTLSLKMPAWTPGYYQLLHFADQVQFIKAKNSSGKELVIVKSGRSGWKVATEKSGWIQIIYHVTAKRSFVATPFVLSDRAYVSPPGVFLHIENELRRPAIVTVEKPATWTVATGLDPLGAKFSASNFDVLYDSPILIGELEELPSFEVKGIRHRFLGYKLGDFDKSGFMNDLRKIVEASVAMMGDIPYKQYTFIAIGPGPGGIEHLNSTSFGFSGESIKTREGRIRMYSFLAHEYYHHYNVKRIRPVELGPFDYDRENRTHMLWVSEGVTVYYDLLLTYRAGLMTREELFAAFASRIASYENKPGKRFQSATDASYNTWSDGPFGRTDDEVNKTVSVYDKGAGLGLLLDLAIRNVSENKKSLDDVMRQLYREYYQRKKRGFTSAEFRATCERIAGGSLEEVFEYASTTKPIDYNKYFAYAGLDIASVPVKLSGGWLGLSVRPNVDSLTISNVEYESPAWNAGLRRNMTLAAEQGLTLEPVLKSRKAGEILTLRSKLKGTMSIVLAEKEEASFAISVSGNPSEKQKNGLVQWLDAPHE